MGVWRSEDDRAGSSVSDEQGVVVSDLLFLFSDVFFLSVVCWCGGL